MPALNVTYAKENYRLRYDRKLYEGIYLNESPYQINLNLTDRDINPEGLEKMGYISHRVTKYDNLAVLTVKGLGQFYQIIITDQAAMDDFTSFCHAMENNLNLDFLVTTWHYAHIENTIRTGLRFPSPLPMLLELWVGN